MMLAAGRPTPVNNTVAMSRGHATRKTDIVVGAVREPPYGGAEPRFLGQCS